MDYLNAVRKLDEGRRVVHGTTVTNGEKEELVIEQDCLFIKTPRKPGAKQDNYIFSNPTVSQILSDDWEVLI